MTEKPLVSGKTAESTFGIKSWIKIAAMVCPDNPVGMLNQLPVGRCVPSFIVVSDLARGDAVYASVLEKDLL